MTKAQLYDELAGQIGEMPATERNVPHFIQHQAVAALAVAVETALMNEKLAVLLERTKPKIPPVQLDPGPYSETA